MKLDLVSKTLLDFLFSSKDLDFSKFSKLEEVKFTKILDSSGIKNKEYLMKQELTKEEKGRILLNLILQEKKPSRIFQELEWHHFELVIATIFSEIGYTTLSNYRFKDEFKRYEIDIIAYNFPYIFFIDCKFNKSASDSYYMQASTKQKERLEAIIDFFPEISEDLIKKLSLPVKQRLSAFPLIIAWKEQPILFHDGVAIIPFNKLSGFIREIDILRYDLFHLYIQIN
ncbi:MAG: hypothetical protein ACTSQE_06310 [Candidatus Heimdallarchaeaceae archaeon]